MDANVTEGLAVAALPEPHRRRSRTVNALERLNPEVYAARARWPSRSGVTQLTSPRSRAVR
jgi:transposase-like protein